MATSSSNIVGQRFEAEVPDTLDLAERGELALHALAGGLDHGDNYRVLGGGECGAVTLGAKFLEAFTAVRLMSGSDYALDVEEGLLKALVSFIGDDGLLYTPANPPKGQTTDRGYPSADEDYTAPLGNGRMMLAMMYRYQLDHDPVWLERTGKMADGLAAVVQYKDDYAYFPEGGLVSEYSYLRRSGYRDAREPQQEHVGPEGSVFDGTNHPVRALAQWYAISGDERALDLAAKITRWLLKAKYWHQGQEIDIVGPERAHWDGHCHGHLITFRSLLWYATVAGDLRLKEFVRSAYEYVRNFGIPRIGWFPSWIGTQDIPTLAETISYKKRCEGCILGDVIALAIKLSEAGQGDYWDDADGYIRNHALEHQLTDRQMIERVRQRIPAIAPNSNFLKRDFLGGYCGATNVTCIPEEYFYPAACCVANGALGLYYAWESIVRHDGEGAQVNLLLNRASPWLDVDSFLPYEGKVVIRNKAAKRVAVRIPGWAERRQVRAAINDRPTSSFWAGNRLVFDRLEATDVITIEFPMVEHTIAYTVPDGELVMAPEGGSAEMSRTRYTCHFKGNTLVDISPRDESSPYGLYRRDHYKGSRAPMKSVVRYVPPRTIVW